MIRIDQLCNYRYRLNLPFIKKTVNTLLLSTKYPKWSIGVQFINYEQMKELNLEYRNKNKCTDILSFPFHEPLTPGSLPSPESLTTDLSIQQSYQDLGDIYLCLEYIELNSKTLDYTMESRLPILLTHGITHLMGYEHEEEKQYFEVSKKKEDRKEGNGVI
ncbi:zincin [Neoconidiobolus thromboides FSU 785]|nr:zincin [Neoconidiobolus thromboides FSU 785]